MATNGPGVVVTGADLTRGRGCLTSRWPGAGRTLGLEVGGGWLLQSLTCDARQAASLPRDISRGTPKQRNPQGKQRNPQSSTMLPKAAL